MDERTRADVERAEAVIVEHYPRLVRLAYLVLPPSMGRHRRVLTAHGLVQRALPRANRRRPPRGLPAQRGPAPSPATTRCGCGSCGWPWRTRAGRARDCRRCPWSGAPALPAGRRRR
ncbi:hypothetical protein PQR15_26385 [Streptomyces lydicus]|nr:hypothetical protein [Streptomyces lydicus]